MSLVSFQSSESSSESESVEYDEPKYEFAWAVKDDSSENDFGHQEARDDEFTSGSYYVHLPDGRLQKVSYTVDGDDGYVAEVTYEGEAQFPSAESQESSEEQRFYAAPRQQFIKADDSSKEQRFVAVPRQQFIKADDSSEEQRFVAPARGYGFPGK